MDKRIILEDSIMEKGVQTTAGSKMLESFVAPFDAEAVTRIKSAGLSIVGKAKMDEFGIDGIRRAEKEETAEAVSAVAEDRADAALCNDFSGRMRRQAAQSGICYIHPTYGSVSRYGLIPAASSMDQIGVMCKDLNQGFEILSLIAGKDDKDGAMFPEKSYSYAPVSDKVRMAVPENISDKGVREFAAHFDTVSINLPYFEVYSQVLYILSCAEICNNTNRYDGVKFGYRSGQYKGLNDLYLKSRTEGFGYNAKLASIMGSYVLSQEQYERLYEKAMKIRRLIKESLLFDTYDVIALPAWSEADLYEQSALYALSTLAGLPAVSFAYQGSGIQLVAGVKKENYLLTAWEEAAK